MQLFFDTIYSYTRYFFDNIFFIVIFRFLNIYLVFQIRQVLDISTALIFLKWKYFLKINNFFIYHTYMCKTVYIYHSNSTIFEDLLIHFQLKIILNLSLRDLDFPSCHSTINIFFS